MIQQHHNNSSRKRACVFSCERGKFATQALFNPSHGTGEYQPRGEHDCREVLFLERACCVMLIWMMLCHQLWLPYAGGSQTTTKFWFSNLFFFCAHHAGTNQAPKATVSYVCTASTIEQPSIGPAQQQSSYTITFVSTRVRQRKHAGMKEQAKCTIVRVFYAFFFLFECCFFFTSS